ncbi:MAG: HAD family phosphatase [Firmicutes bacterium]|uniref:HAD family phosphatase n=1 Tax=Candidatus Gallilactobacillus intestinavium TaxID=2840838 RepID=A0A9D9E5Y0_9LACO|nr:HAD family phosphatase [Candidatus Gallilactobacillus intestinavium]
MNQKLIILDLDGTLLNNQNQLSNKTINIIQQIEKLNHICVIATGRPYRLAEPIYKKLNLHHEMINFNGSLCLIPNQKVEYKFTIPNDIILDVLNNKNNLGIQYISAENEYCYFSTNQRYDNLFLPTIKNKNELLNSENIQNKKLIFSSFYYDRNYKKQIINFFKNYTNQISLNVWGGNCPIIEILHKNINKTFGIQYLMKKYNIKQQDVIAFGDEFNDLPTLEFAGIGVAMKNAETQLKKVSSYITKNDNNHDGVANFLRHYLKL